MRRCEGDSANLRRRFFAFATSHFRRRIFALCRHILALSLLRRCTVATSHSRIFALKPKVRRSKWPHRNTIQNSQLHKCSVYGMHNVTKTLKYFSFVPIIYSRIASSLFRQQPLFDKISEKF